MLAVMQALLGRTSETRRVRHARKRLPQQSGYTERLGQLAARMPGSPTPPRRSAPGSR